MSKITDEKVVAINTDSPEPSNSTKPVLPIGKISRLLVANRGEIACRIIATAKKMGIKTIAVYSEADRQAKHVAMADYAVMIGPAPALDSYLNSSRIIEAAQSLAADAIHPGYGFLSENDQFAGACLDNGFIFIGPPADAIRAMSSKSEAKTIMEHAQVPLIPGYHGSDNSPQTLLSVASQIGYPVLLKAALGGGGKGMRIVNSPSEMTEAIASAKREAHAAFGNDLLLIEKYLVSPRHIEVQIFADQHGNTIYLSDRDCSIQRRHQKIVEEAPAPNLSERLRQTMGEAAVNAAKAIGYTGAGTVEFLLDASGNFYFMEMNTRLQVEHPVTELITDQDLVKWQINVAEGQPLPLRQNQIRHRGHAIEVRIYAEDPRQGFLPSSGYIHYLNEPDTETGNNQSKVRLDTGIRQGDVVTSFYDPMLSKVIVWGQDRKLAVNQLSLTLADYHLIGPETNIDYLQRIISHPAFRSSDINTHFIEQHQAELERDMSPQLELQLSDDEDANNKIGIPKLALFAAMSAISAPGHFSFWRLNHPPYQDIQVIHEQGARYQFRFHTPSLPSHSTENQTTDIKQVTLTQLEIGNQLHELKPVVFYLLSSNEENIAFGCKIEHAAIRESFTRVDCHEQSHIFYQQWHDIYHTGKSSNHHHISHDENTQAIAPLNGIVTALHCQPGDQVNKGQPLLTIEAMKMEYTVNAPHEGKISGVFFSIGDQVEHGEQLLSFADIH